MIKINLLPSRIVEKRKKRDFAIFVSICAVCALGICYLFYLSLNQTIFPLEDRLAELTDKIKQYQPVLQEIEQIKQKNKRLQDRFNAFKKVVIRQSFWPELLYFIYRSLPDTLWLDEIKSDNEKGFIEVKGKSLNKTIGVAEFIRKLESSKFFSEVRFTSFSQQELGGRQVMLFQIKCFLSEDFKG